jgi:hypothetical protein
MTEFQSPKETQGAFGPVQASSGAGPAPASELDEGGAAAQVGTGNAAAAAPVMAHWAEAGDSKDAAKAEGGACVSGTPTPSAGEPGMLLRELTLKVGGKDVKAPQGAYVVCKEVKGKELVVKIYSGLGGAEATIQAADFKSQPEITHKDAPNADQPRDDLVYTEYESILWDGAPKAADVAQGGIADCYLIAAAGAVAAANPNAIKKLFSPQTPNQKSYQVTLYLINEKTGKREAKAIPVDTNLPTKLEDVTRKSPAYAMHSWTGGFKDKNKPLWPALLEKAYAQAMGGYEAIGHGGLFGTALATITGEESDSDAIAGKDDDLVKQFQQYKKDGKAVVCGTVGSRSSSKQGGFTGSGEGPYSASLKSDLGEAARIVPGSLKVYDKGGKVAQATDNSNGKLTGADVDSGTVAYRQGTVEIKYKSGKCPAKPEDLLADYQWRGKIDADIPLYAWHGYMFDDVKDGKLVFKNPWGSDHPRAMTPAEFRKHFTSITHSEVPKD